ncbi:MAG: GumC family protein, partial [Alphaproteobacteria bacterium]
MDDFAPKKDDAAAQPPRRAGATAVARSPLEKPDLIELFRQLWRRKMEILSTIVLVTLLATLVAFQITPRYSATAKIMIDSQRSRIVDVEDFMSGLGMDNETVQNEIQVIASRSLAQKVIDKLGLMQDAEFNPYLSEPGTLKTWVNALLGTSDDALSEDERYARERIAVVDVLLDRLEVMPEKRSRVINIDFTTYSSKKAAQIANTYAELYLLEQLEAKFEATKRGTEWLNERVAELRKTVEASERAVELFRKETGLIRGKDTTVTSQQISEINTQLILARTQRAEAEARLKQVESLVRSPGGVESAAEVLASPLIQRLREQEAEIQRKAAELASEYGVRHPRMINIRAEIEDLQAKIRGEVNKIVEGLRNEVGVALARESALSSNLNKLKVEAAELNSAEVRLRILEREANANRTLFDTFLGRLKETAGQEEIQQPDARIISHADVPNTPSSPKIKLIFMVALASSIFMGIGVAFITERLDTGFRSSEQIESMIETATLGLLPLLSGRQLGDQSPEEYVLERPASSFSEALRTVHTGLLLSDVDNPPKTVL